MGFEDDNDPANQPIDREEYEAYDRDCAAHNRLTDAAPELLAACQAAERLLFVALNGDELSPQEVAKTGSMLAKAINQATGGTDDA